MDALSITAAPLSIAKLCVSTGWELKLFIDGAKMAGTAVNALLVDIEGFQKTLEQLNSVLADPRIKRSVQLTGNVGNHWTNLKTSLDDARDTLVCLEATVMRINKNVGVWNSARKHIRLKSASDKLVMYQQQIRSYKDTIQVCLQTAVLLVS
jgi:phosphodiesterase/alkaline phosphatase D-like protein